MGRGRMEELTVPVEDFVGECLDDHHCGLHEAWASLVHRNAEAGILDAGRPPPESEEASATR